MRQTLEQALDRGRIGFHGFKRPVVIQAPGVRQDPFQLGPVLVPQLLVRIVDEQTVFEIQASRPGIDVVARE